MKLYGLSVSPCIVPLLIWIGGVAPKWLPWKEVIEFLCRFYRYVFLHLWGSLNLPLKQAISHGQQSQNVSKVTLCKVNVII